MSTLIEKKFQDKLKSNGEDAEKGSTPEYKEQSPLIKYIKIVKNSAKIMHYLVLGLIDLMNIVNNKFSFSMKKFSPKEACMEIV